MVTKGGYRLIDFGGVDISISKTISGIYNKIADTDKRIVGCNLVYSTTKFKELTLDVKKVGTDYVLTNSVIKVVIGSDNAVVGLALTDDNSSNKKIYCHPIVITKDSTIKFSCAFLLFNNDENALDTFAKLKTELFRIASLAGGTANIVCTGKITNGIGNFVVSHMYVTSNGISVYGLDDNNAYDGIEITNETPTVLVDGVNPIN